MSEPATSDEVMESRRRRRMSTAFGWIAGGALGLLLNYGIFRGCAAVLPSVVYPTVPTTFVFFALGAFGGMAVSDRLGPRAFRPLGIAAGVLLALFVVLVAAVLMSPAQPSP